MSFPANHDICYFDGQRISFNFTTVRETLLIFLNSFEIVFSYLSNFLLYFNKTF